MKKPKERKGKIIFIDAKEELRIDRTNAWLEPKHIKNIAGAYWKFKDADGFAKVMSNKEVLENNGNLSVQLYVTQTAIDNKHNVKDLIADVKQEQKQVNDSLDNLYKELREIGIEA
jgi:type I restriction enzyme M protein